MLYYTSCLTVTVKSLKRGVRIDVSILRINLMETFLVDSSR